LGKIVPRVIRAFPNRSRAAKRRSQQIQRMTSRERRTRQTRKYRELQEVTQEVGQSDRGVLHRAKTHRVGLLEAATVPALRHQISELLPTGIKRGKVLTSGDPATNYFSSRLSQAYYAPCVDPSRLYICVGTLLPY